MFQLQGHITSELEIDYYNPLDSRSCPSRVGATHDFILLPGHKLPAEALMEQETGARAEQEEELAPMSGCTDVLRNCTPAFSRLTWDKIPEH